LGSKNLRLNRQPSGQQIEQPDKRLGLAGHTLGVPNKVFKFEIQKMITGLVEEARATSQS
jgi:hypothetical protein